jgi:subtilisin family serine protease
VAAAIGRCAAPRLYAVKVFDRSLSTRISTLLAALDWSVRNRMHVVNLSLGTARAEHEDALRGAVARARASGVVIVAAAEDEGVRWLPGSLPGVVAVQLDPSCPRHEYRVTGVNGTAVYRASGFPRAIPNVPPERNLNGISFAVANMSGFVARARERAAGGSIDEMVRLLAAAGAGGPLPE